MHFVPVIAQTRCVVIFPGDETPLNLDGDAPTGGFFRDPVLWQFRTKTYPVLWHFWTETYPVLWHFWPKTYPVLWTNFHKVALFMKNSVKVYPVHKISCFSRRYPNFYPVFWWNQVRCFVLWRLMGHSDPVLWHFSWKKDPVLWQFWGKRTLFYGKSRGKGPCFMANFWKKDPVCRSIPV